MVSTPENSRMRAFVTEYCDSTTVHGIRYLGEFYRSIVERVFWVIILSISLLLCAKLTWQVLDKWENHPVIISFDERSTPVASIPFPAVTVCPGNQINSSIFKFSPFIDELFDVLMLNTTFPSFTAQDWETAEAFFNYCSKMTFAILPFPNITLQNTTIDNFKRVHPTFESAFSTCTWKGSPLHCSDIWTKSLTADGICYTFNTIGYENILREETTHSDYVLEEIVKREVNWDPEEGYSSVDKSATKYPMRVLSAGFELGLSLDLIGYAEDNEIYCGGIVPGFKMILHAPNDLPQSLKNFVRIPFGQESLIAIKPSMRKTSSNLKSYPAYKRQCYFSSEKYLRYFKSYSQSNCELECLGNYSLHHCGCVGFELPRSFDTTVCRPHNIQCQEETYRKMVLAEIAGGECDCLPSCTEIAYDMEVSQSEILTENATDSELLKASVALFFKEDQFWTSIRSELYGVTELVGNIGGVLGLFMGFSILSVVELFYFITLHLLKHFKNKVVSDN